MKVEPPEAGKADEVLLSLPRVQRGEQASEGRGEGSGIGDEARAVKVQRGAARSKQQQLQLQRGATADPGP